MAKKRITKRVSRKFSDEEKRQYQKIREQVMEEFPPVKRSRRPSPPGVPSQIRAAREARGRRDLAQRLRPTDVVNHLSAETRRAARDDRERTVLGLHRPFFYDG